MEKKKDQVGYLCFITLMLICASLCQGANNCSNFEVLNVPDEVANSVCVTEFSTTDCRQFVESFNRSELPEGFPQGGPDVERPGGIDLLPLSSPYTANNVHYVHPGVAVTWEAPVSSAAKTLLKGYLVTWAVEGSMSTYCRLFYLNTSSSVAEEELQFRTTIPFLPVTGINQNVTVRVYSMPPPPVEKKDDERQFQSALMKTFKPYQQGNNPGYWTPSVVLKGHSNGSIDVRFILSPEVFNFTQFRIMLMKRSHSEVDQYQSKNITVPLYSAEATYGYVQFNNLETDQYAVVVKIVDTFQNEPGRCLCWTGENKLCKNTCESIFTQWLQLNVTVPAKPETTKGPLTSSGPPTSDGSHTSDKPLTSDASATAQLPDPPLHSTLTNEDNNNQAIIIGTVLGVVALIAIVVAAVCLKRKNSTVTMLKDKLCPDERQPAPFPDRYSTNSAGFDNRVLRPAPVVIQDKTVFIMSADDHVAQTELVKSLAVFLEKHCHCKVIWHNWAEVRDKGVYAWVTANIVKAQHIMFVDSPGAEKLVDAHLNKKIYRQRRDWPEGEAFTIALGHVFTKPEARERQVLVSFGTENCKPYLTGQPFQLPSNLPQLLRKLHGLDPKNSDAYSDILPLRVENLKYLEEGVALLDAIAKSKSYEKEHPDWLQVNFGEPMPILQTTLSNSPSVTDSGIISDGFPRSVSCQDLHSPRSCQEQSDFNVEIGDGFEEVSAGPHAIGYLTPSIFTTQLSTQSSGLGDSPTDGDVESIWNKERFHKQICPPESMSTVNSTAISDLFRKNFNPQILPPDTMSTVPDGNISEAFRNFNQDADYASSYQPVEPPCSETSGRDESGGFSIKPPKLDSSDTHPDSTSSCLRNINADSESAYC